MSDLVLPPAFAPVLVGPAFTTADNPVPLWAPRNPNFEYHAHKFLVDKTCLGCGGRLHLQCHHKYPFHLYPDREMDERYWRPLCMDPDFRCHLLLGHGDGKHGNWSFFNQHIDNDAYLRLKVVRELGRERAIAYLFGTAA